MRTGTSRTGNAAPPDGFTLLELIVVMAIIGIAAAFAVPSVFAGRTTAELRSASNAIADGLRRTRAIAVLQGREVSFQLDVEARRFQVPGSKPFELSRRLVLALRTASDEVLTDARGGIRFFPDGSSTGGRIDVRPTDEESRANRIAVDWLTGRISVSSGREAAR